MLELTLYELIVSNCTGVGMQWGAWASVGMASLSENTLARIKRSGMGLLKPSQGLVALHMVLHERAETVLLANPFQWPQLLQNVQRIPYIFGEQQSLRKFTLEVHVTHEFRVHNVLGRRITLMLMDILYCPSIINDNSMSIYRMQWAQLPKKARQST